MTSLIPHLIDFFLNLLVEFPYFIVATVSQNLKWMQRGGEKCCLKSKKKKIAKLACVVRIYHAVFTLVTCVLPS